MGRSVMAASFWQGGERKGKFLALMTVINLAFAGTTVFAWAMIAIFVAEPISWATWSHVGIHSRPGLLEYPFILLWLLPSVGTGIAWICDRLTLRKLSRFTVLFPLLLIGLSVAWFNIVGDQFR